tara:strand:+ start:311 stop:1651 length:1341 start_codon:yes stop_codon:yes gene_type:complete
MRKINFKNIILCLVLIIPLKTATHFFLFKEEALGRIGEKLIVDASFEYHFYRTFTDKLWIFPIIIFTMIFILWYFDLYLIKKENPSKNKNITKKPKPNDDNKNKEVLKEYYENGKLNYEAEAIDGIKNGYYKDYYESGALKVETTFKDDLMDGECKFYFESGNLSELSHYTAGEPTVGSIVKRYFENGDLQEEVSVSKEGEEFKETVIKNNLDFLKIDVKAFSDSTIKDIDEFDEEKKKQLMEKTIFFDKYGYADKTKGRATTIIEGLEFISRLKGIKENEFVFDIATFLRMGDDYPPSTDKDGKWYVKFGNTLVKYFSEKKFKPALKELLKTNNIDEKNAQLTLKTDTLPVRIYETYGGDGFDIKFYLGTLALDEKNEPILNDDGSFTYNKPENDKLTKMILIVNHKQSDDKDVFRTLQNSRLLDPLESQSLSYIHIEGKGLYSL